MAFFLLIILSVFFVIEIINQNTMKNSLTPFVLLLFINSMLCAQVRIGPKVGLNLANYTGNVSSDVRGLAALQAGGVAEIEIIDMLSIQPELLFSVQGVTVGETKLVNSYISLPIMGRFYPVDFLYIETGPQLGFLIAANEKNRANKVRVSQNYKTVDIGLSFGVGTKITDLGLGFGIRYYAGLSNIFIDNARIKNGVFQIFAEYKFDL
jgi:hypothetical protein